MPVMLLMAVFMIVIFILFKIGEKYDKYSKRINIGIGVFLVVITLCVIYSYVITHNSTDVKLLKQALQIINNDVGELNVDLSNIDELGIDGIVRMYNNEVLNNFDYKPNMSISKIDDMYEFTDKFSFADDASNWVNCYIKYTAWCLAEYTLDEDCEDYWEMKYKSSDKVASYNYGLIVKYKTQGFFIKYAPTVVFCTIILQIFVWSYWFLISKKDLFIRRNKSDLQN